MSKMPRESADRMRSAREELAALIRRHVEDDGEIEIRPGLFASRQSVPGLPLHGAAAPSFCVVAQGRKTVSLGAQRFDYDPANYLITSLDLPLSAEVSDISPAHPYLGLRLALDPAIVAAVLADEERGESPILDEVPSIAVAALDADLLDAAVRLMRLVEDPDSFAFLSPLIVREIVFRLSRQGESERLRRIVPVDGPTQRIGHVADLIRRRFAEKLTIDELAHAVHMSPSVLHTRFKAVTAMSPIQFQKLLRLQEARRLMLSEGLDAGQAGARVGYNDTSQFSRDYKRRFGRPPRSDVEHVRRTMLEREGGA
ncbi:MAG: AraC family transcriptional regulator [Planctomycetota bacterium]